MENKYEFKGTPAPWFPIEYAGFWQIQDEDAYHSRDVLNYDDAINAAMELKGVSEEKAEANAHLIAAAPELLRDVKDMVEVLDLFISESQTGSERRDGLCRAKAQLLTTIHKALNITL